MTMVASMQLSCVMRVLLVLVQWWVFCCCCKNTAVSAEPHPHTGKVTPFQSGDPGVKLGPDALNILKSGKPYKTQIQSGATGGRGMVVQDVHAPTSIVWERILDFDNYPKMVPKTVETKVYKTETIPQKSRHQKGIAAAQRIWVRMKIGFPVLKLQFYINHLYDPAQNSMTWTLDYSQKSDLDDSCGYWYVIPHPDNPNEWSRVYYSVDVSMFSWVPQFVVDFMSKQALIDATAWVKKQSELVAAAITTSSSSAAVVGADGSSSTLVGDDETKKALGGWWGRHRRQASNKHGGLADGSSSVVDAQQEQVDSVATASEKQQRIGMTRYALVSTVLALSFYNVHLYLSQ